MAHFGLTELQSKKIAARQKASRAIRLGRIVRPDTCSDCGKACRPEGHHPDYEKPLELLFLCKKCHIALHVANGTYVRSDEYLENMNRAWRERREMHYGNKGGK